MFGIATGWLVTAAAGTLAVAGMVVDPPTTDVHEYTDRTLRESPCHLDMPRYEGGIHVYPEIRREDPEGCAHSG